MNIHPFINYGKAVVMASNGFSKESEISRTVLIDEVTRLINHFRVKPDSEIMDQTSVKFSYCDIEKGNPKNGIYLASSILSTDKDAGKIFISLNKLKSELSNDKITSSEISRSISPVSGEYARFGTVIGRGKPKTSIEVAVFCSIATATHKKPCFSFKTIKKEKVENENQAIFPDLSIEDLVDFINLFEKMRDTCTERLMVGNVNAKDKKPNRPKIFDGNFPNAPRSSSLGSVSLLGAIGSWANDASMIDWANKVLDSLKSKPIYIIGNKTFETFRYSHYIIELAKENKLNSIIDCIYYVVLYNQGTRSRDNRLEYQKFDLFASRFLQLFTRPAFKDFLSFRAEYPNQIEILLKAYFINMEKIDKEVVISAKELGKWLNYAAYRVAKSNVGGSNYEKIREQKAKALVEIESSIFSARSGDALVFQAITRAGRASGLDAPSEAELFMTQASTGEISLESAKHLLIAFSRVKNKYEPKIKSENREGGDDESDDVNEDLSDAQH